MLERLTDESVDCIYLDPPLGLSVNITPQDHFEASELPDSVRQWIAFISPILRHAHRVLSGSGSLFFHATPDTAPTIHLLLRQIFGWENAVEEFTWPIRTASAATKIGARHEVILMYGKTTECTLNRVYRPHNAEEISHIYWYQDHGRPYRPERLMVSQSRPPFQFEWKGCKPGEGQSWKLTRPQLDQLEAEGQIHWGKRSKMPALKRYLDDSPGIPVGTIWNDIRPARPRFKKSPIAPAEKPLQLLERIILIGSNEDDVVLDSFCGSGAALAAAHINDRRWIGCDICAEAIRLSVDRLCGDPEFQLQRNVDYTFGDDSTLQRIPVVQRFYQPVFSSLRDWIAAVGVRFVLNETIPIEETRHYEFKELKGRNPVRSIIEIADKYVVAYLNSEGGRILWGVNDERKAVGVILDSANRDEIRRVASEKLGAIQPPLTPRQYRLEFHQVFDADSPVPDLVVLEISVPKLDSRGLFYTGRGEAWVKTPGGLKQLTGPALEDEIISRRGLSPQ